MSNWICQASSSLWLFEMSYAYRCSRGSFKTAIFIRIFVWVCIKVVRFRVIGALQLKKICDLLFQIISDLTFLIVNCWVWFFVHVHNNCISILVSKQFFNFLINLLCLFYPLFTLALFLHWIWWRRHQVLFLRWAMCLVWKLRLTFGRTILWLLSLINVELFFLRITEPLSSFQSFVKRSLCLIRWIRVFTPLYGSCHQQLLLASARKTIIVEVVFMIFKCAHIPLQVISKNLLLSQSLIESISSRFYLKKVSSNLLIIEAVFHASSAFTAPLMYLMLKLSVKIVSFRLTSISPLLLRMIFRTIMRLRRRIAACYQS